MTIRVVGAGLGRTGTNSLKLALEQLLGGRCYHMLEVFERPEDTAPWHSAVRGEPVTTIVHDHWRRFGRHYYARHDFEGLESAGAERLMASLRGRVGTLAGQGLARLETTAMLRALVERVERIEVTGEPTWAINNIIRRHDQLPIKLFAA